MTTYNTGNPLGSVNVKDLYDNAQNLDTAVNDRSATQWTDRFGAPRLTWWGMEQGYQSVLQGSQLELPPLIYTDGTPLTVLRSTQVIQRGSTLYRVKLPSSFPVNLTGTWATDEPKLVLTEDAALRQQLATASVSTGAAMVAGGTQVVTSIGNLKTLLKTSPSKWAMVSGYTVQGDGGGGLYYRDDADTTSADNGGSVIVASDGARWKLADKLNIRPEQFGAKGDWNGTTGTDDQSQFNQIFNHMVANPGCTLFLTKRHLVSQGIEASGLNNVVIAGTGTSGIHANTVTKNTLWIHDSTSVFIRGGLFSQPRTFKRSEGGFCVYLWNVGNGRVENVRTDGGTAGIWVNHCANVNVVGCNVSTPKADGIHFSHGSNYCKAIGNTVRDRGDDGIAASYYDSTTGRAHHIEIVDNIIDGGVWGFGIALYSCDDVLISGNLVTDSPLGLVTVTEHNEVAGTPCTGIKIVGNQGKRLNRTNVVPNSYWEGTADGAIVSPGHMSGMVIGGTDIDVNGNAIIDAHSGASGATPRKGCNIIGGVRIKVCRNTFSQMAGDGIFTTPSTSLAESCINNNDFDEVSGVPINILNTAIVTSLGVVGNYGGFTSGGGVPYLIQIQNAGSAAGIVANNCSSGQRGLNVDTGTGSPNIKLFNNNVA